MSTKAAMAVGSRALSASLDFIIDGSDIMVYMKRHEAEILQRREAARSKAAKARESAEQSQKLLEAKERKDRERIQRDYDRILVELEKARLEQYPFTAAQLSCTNSSGPTTIYFSGNATQVPDITILNNTVPSVSSAPADPLAPFATLLASPWTLVIALFVMLLVSLGFTLHGNHADTRNLLSIKQELHNVEQDLNRQKASDDSKQSALVENKVKILALHTQIATEYYENVELSRTFEETAAEKQRLELDKSEVELQELRSQLASATSDNEELKRDYDAKLQSVQQELRDAEQQYRDQQKTADDSKQSGIDDFEKLKRELRTEIDSAKTQNEELTRANKKAVSEKQLLERFKSDSEVEIKGLRSQVASEKSENEKQKRAYDKMAADKQLMETDLVKVNQSLSHVQQQLHDAEIDSAAHRKDSDAKQLRIKEYEEKNLQLHEQIASMESQISQDRSAFDEITNENQELKRNFAQVNESCDHLQSALDSANDKLRREKQIHENVRVSAYQNIQQLVEVNSQGQRKFKVITRLLLRRNASLEGHGDDVDNKADGLNHNEPSNAALTPEKQPSEAGDCTEEVTDLAENEDHQEDDSNEDADLITETGRKPRRRQRGRKGKPKKAKQTVADDDNDDLKSNANSEQSNGPPANAPTGPRSTRPNVYRGPSQHIGRMPAVQTLPQPTSYPFMATDPVPSSAYDSMAEWQLKSIAQGATAQQSAPISPFQNGMQASCWAVADDPVVPQNEAQTSPQAENNSPVQQQNGMQASIWADTDETVLPQDGSQASEAADSDSPVQPLNGGMLSSRWVNDDPISPPSWAKNKNKNKTSKKMNGNANEFKPGKRN